MGKHHIFYLLDEGGWRFCFTLGFCQWHYGSVLDRISGIPYLHEPIQRLLCQRLFHPLAYSHLIHVQPSSRVPGNYSRGHMSKQHATWQTKSYRPIVNFKEKLTTRTPRRVVLTAVCVVLVSGKRAHHHYHTISPAASSKLLHARSPPTLASIAHAEIAISSKSPAGS
jgi:hypothetical protein